MTKVLSPVCGDDSLALFLMKGYNYSSPMARCVNVPIYDSDDSISDDELESEVCQTCVFCARENIRHHKTKTNEIPIIRRIRSPCRCFHECVAKDADNGKNYIMERFLRQKLDDFSPELKDSEQNQNNKRPGSPTSFDNNQNKKIPRIISEAEIETTRDELKKIQPKEEIEIVEVCEDPKPVVIECRSVASPIPAQPTRLNCHRMPQRVSVIQPTKIEDKSSHSSHSYIPKMRQSPASVSGRNSTQSSSYVPRARHVPEQNPHFTTESPTDLMAAETVIKVENTNHMEGYGTTMVLKQPIQTQNYPVNLGPRRDHNFGIISSLGSQMSSISGQCGSENTFYIKQPYVSRPQPGSCHVNQSQTQSVQFGHQFINARMQPHEENGNYSNSSLTLLYQLVPSVITQDELNRRILQPGHPPRIRACIERLAAKLTVSRTVAEQNEKQVAELLQLACEV